MCLCNWLHNSVAYLEEKNVDKHMDLEFISYSPPFKPTNINNGESLCGNEHGHADHPPVSLPQSKSAVWFVNCECVRVENVSSFNGGLKRLDLIKSCQPSTRNDL